MDNKYLIHIGYSTTKIYWHAVRRCMQRVKQNDDVVKTKICTGEVELLAYLERLGVDIAPKILSMPITTVAYENREGVKISKMDHAYMAKKKDLFEVNRIISVFEIKELSVLAGQSDPS